MGQMRLHGTAGAIEHAIKLALDANEFEFARRLAEVATHLSTPHYSALVPAGQGGRLVLAP